MNNRKAFPFRAYRPIKKSIDLSRLLKEKPMEGEKVLWYETSTSSFSKLGWIGVLSIIGFLLYISFVLVPARKTGAEALEDPTTMKITVITYSLFVFTIIFGLVYKSLSSLKETNVITTHRVINKNFRVTNYLLFENMIKYQIGAYSITYTGACLDKSGFHLTKVINFPSLRELNLAVDTTQKQWLNHNAHSNLKNKLEVFAKAYKLEPGDPTLNHGLPRSMKGDNNDYYVAIEIPKYFPLSQLTIRVVYLRVPSMYFLLYPQKSASGLVDVLAGNDFKIEDREFDQTFIIKSNTPNEVTDLLSSSELKEKFQVAAEHDWCSFEFGNKDQFEVSKNTYFKQQLSDETEILDAQMIPKSTNFISNKKIDIDSDDNFSTFLFQGKPNKNSQMDSNAQIKYIKESLDLVLSVFNIINAREIGKN